MVDCVVVLIGCIFWGDLEQVRRPARQHMHACTHTRTHTHSGKFYSVNVPLKDGTSDESFHALFKPIVRKVMEVFQPGAVVLQCGESGHPCASLALCARPERRSRQEQWCWLSAMAHKSTKQAPGFRPSLADPVAPFHQGI